MSSSWARASTPPAPPPGGNPHPLLITFSRTSSVSPNCTRDFVSQGDTEEEREEKEKLEEEQEEKEKTEKEELEMPLKLATLSGKQEIVLKFTEVNQFGLPRAVDEVEVGLNRLLLHVFPHQV